ncbi:MAG: VanW family protein [Polyangiaceae bacterium]|nr:VanW family protein [Polyangiaceae bacterium]
MLRRAALLFGSMAIAAGLALGGRALDARARAALEAELPAPGLGPTGLKIDGQRVPAGKPPRQVADERASELLDRRVTLLYDSRELAEVSLRELGATIDVEAVANAASTIGQRGGLLSRVGEARAARRGRYDLALHVELPIDALAQRLVPLKELLDVAPVPARRKVDREQGRDVVSEHKEGAYLDLYAAAEAVLTTARKGEERVELGPFRVVPAATRQSVEGADIATVVASFETRFGGPAGRDGNIRRAAGLLHGLVLMPNEAVSFNEAVGPRSVDNGFYSAPEIYKGEMREGIGGGSCQVASTLYAAAFFGGFEVVERRNHSRPSGYIRPGMDATVSFPVLDLRLKNPYDFPVVVSAKAEAGKLRFELLGKERRVDVSLATETLGILKYSRKLEKAPFLPAGEFRVKQKGKRGLSIKKLKTVKDLASGLVTVEETKDIYPATQEILLIGPGVSEDSLPPLEPPAAPSAPASAEASDAREGATGGGA